LTLIPKIGDFIEKPVCENGRWTCMDGENWALALLYWICLEWPEGCQLYSLGLCEARLTQCGSTCNKRDNMW
jgi:hypothetical protein